jgi:hypothetical protein
VKFIHLRPPYLMVGYLIVFWGHFSKKRVSSWISEFLKIFFEIKM